LLFIGGAFFFLTIFSLISRYINHRYFNPFNRFRNPLKNTFMNKKVQATILLAGIAIFVLMGIIANSLK
jgi:hypothetical protein